MKHLCPCCLFSLSWLAKLLSDAFCHALCLLFGLWQEGGPGDGQRRSEVSVKGSFELGQLSWSCDMPPQPCSLGWLCLLLQLRDSGMEVTGGHNLPRPLLLLPSACPSSGGPSLLLLSKVQGVASPMTLNQCPSSFAFLCLVLLSKPPAYSPLQPPQPWIVGNLGGCCPLLKHLLGRLEPTSTGALAMRLLLGQLCLASCPVFLAPCLLLSFFLIGALLCVFFKLV